MTGLDTNVLVRILTGDDAVLKRAAERYVASACTSEEPGFVNRVVLVELVWVLESAYGYARADIATALRRVLETEELAVENADVVRTALRAYEAGADFADAVIAETNALAGCEVTATLDRAAAGRLPHFRCIVPSRR